MKNRVVLIMAVLLLVTLLAGCGGYDDTVQTCVIANEGYLVQDDLKTAKQPTSLNPGNTVYASIHFIESPQGMEYSVKWYLNDAEIKEETKATQKGPQDIIVFELEAKDAVTGLLKVEIKYQDTVLLTRAISIQ